MSLLNAAAVAAGMSLEKKEVRAMNIIEAIKSGKEFKRPHCDDKYHVGSFDYLYRQQGGRIQLRVEEILAEDWEIAEEKATITKSEFLDAYHRANYKALDSGRKVYGEDIAREIFK